MADPMGLCQQVLERVGRPYQQADAVGAFNGHPAAAVKVQARQLQVANTPLVLAHAGVAVLAAGAVYKEAFIPAGVQLQ